MEKILNPVLSGFFPDPSIVRAGEDYYIATSTFEWWPGVALYHSRDLINWRDYGHALHRRSQLDLTGNPDSGGVWAPCLSHHDGRFWLVYSDVKVLTGPFKDVHNYLVTAPTIAGPWSEPIYIHAIGFDPSLFHDDDGRKWVVSLRWGGHSGQPRFNGIVIQEFDAQKKCLVGSPEEIFRGTSLGFTEGPHIYRRNGFYYLLTAEGGTGYRHAVTVARSRTLRGPYETDRAGPVLTSAGRPDLNLQKAGHGSLVVTPGDEWFMAHLCARPLRGMLRAPMGRETALQRMTWTDDGWLRLAHGGNAPADELEAPDLPRQIRVEIADREDFDMPVLGTAWQSLRTPIDESWLSLGLRKGWLCLTGRESLASRHRQSLVAQRLRHHAVEVVTCLEFEPHTYQQAAGLVWFYDVNHWYYLHVTGGESGMRRLNVWAMDKAELTEFPDYEMRLPPGSVYLCGRSTGVELNFFWSQDGVSWREIGPSLDASKLSDEYTGGRFTGTFIGLCCQDMSGAGARAYFDFFHYRPIEPEFPQPHIP